MKAPLPERWFLMAEYFGRVAADHNESQERRDEAGLLAALFLGKAIEYEPPDELS